MYVYGVYVCDACASLCMRNGRYVCVSDVSPYLLWMVNRQNEAMS